MKADVNLKDYYFGIARTDYVITEIHFVDTVSVTNTNFGNVYII